MGSLANVCVLCIVHLNNKVVCLNDKYAIWGDVVGNYDRFSSILWKNFAWEMELEKVIHYDKKFEEWKLP